jgi:CRP-like cAMP-binding protein
MLDDLLARENIVHIGAFLYLAGFLCRSQLMLRGFIVAGDIVYILYFYLAPAVPLWGGIFWSLVFTLANLAMIGRILSDRSTYGMSEDDRALHGLLDTLTPGEFRRLMRSGHWNRTDEPVTVTIEGQPLHQLAYVIDGTIAIEKAGHAFTAAPPTFIGEVAFLIDRPASATVTLGPGTRYVTWDTAQLRRLLLRSPALRIGLGAAFNRDMAEKVARA